MNTTFRPEHYVRTGAPIACRSRWACYVSAWLILLGLLGIGWTAMAQKAPRKSAKTSTVKQGICGTVLVKSGNQMPGPGAPARTGKPVVRDVLVFPLLNASQVDMGENGFVQSVRSNKPLKTLKTCKNGKFCVSLPVGTYTLMVREPKGLYANLSDAQNNIFPVTVQKNRATSVTVDITHEAVF